MIIGAVVLALVAAAAVCATLVRKHGTAATANGRQLAAKAFDFTADRRQLWSVPGKTTTLAKQINYLGTWYSGKSVIVGDTASLTAYDLTTGKPGGMKPEPPSTGAAPCAMSENVSDDGRAALVYRSEGGPYSTDPCTVLTVMDTRTGRVVWHHDLLPGADVADYSNDASSVAVDSRRGRSTPSQRTAALPTPSPRASVCGRPAAPTCAV